MDAEIRRRVFERDNYTCRYCGSKEGSFHADHVYPWVKGGETSINNLVTACETCNTKKGSKVGVYPLPVGYFEPKPHINIITVWGITDLIIAFIGMANDGGTIAIIFFAAGIFLSLVGLYTSFAGKGYKLEVKEEDE